MKAEPTDASELSLEPNTASLIDRRRAEIRPYVIRGNTESDFGRLARHLRQIAGDATLLVAEQPVAARSHVRALALVWAAIDELEQIR